MGKGGAIQKCILDGLEWELSSDNDANVTIGGRYITEMQATTGKPYAIVDKIPGATKGLETRVGLKDGTLVNFNTMLEKCANEDNGVSAMLILADGGKLTAAGGANVVVSGAEDGMMGSREGKLEFDIHPLNGEWIPS